MSTTFGQMRTNIGTRIGDTSTSFATTIGTYINQRYKEFLRRVIYQGINPDFTMTATSASTVVCAGTYTLPADFGKELYVWNKETATDIPYLSYDKLEQEYESNLQQSGTVDYYTIFTTVNSTCATAEASAPRVTKIRFLKAPTTDTYFTIPYVMRPASLTTSADEFVVDGETAIEYGATSDAWTSKRQFAKAQYFEGLYEKAIQNFLWDKDNQPNQIQMMSPVALDRNEGI